MCWHWMPILLLSKEELVYVVSQMNVKQEERLGFISDEGRHVGKCAFRTIR